jgi:predicted  nucleic acid-binding Zn-ribbon protein
MNNISQQDMETLVSLQEAESEIVRLRGVLKKIEKEKKKIGARLVQFEQDMERDEQALSDISKTCRDIEREIGILDERIIRSNEKLRMVKTNKEYQLLLREVDDSKKRKDMLETELLGHFEEKDRLDGIVCEKRKEYVLLKEQIEEEQKQTEQKFQDDIELLDEYVNRQKEIGKNLDPALMTQFARISKMNNGSAVVNVKDEVCMGCFMNIPPQLYIEVRRANSLITCPQCSRILYYKPEE